MPVARMVGLCSRSGVSHLTDMVNAAIYQAANGQNEKGPRAQQIEKLLCVEYVGCDEADLRTHFK